MEYKFTVDIILENNSNYNQNLFYLKCLLDNLKQPNDLLTIKDFNIIKQKSEEKTW
jgi:hypothetical protein